MSINKRSDVKNHLSTRAGTIIFPFGPADQPNIPDDKESEQHSTKPNVPGSENAVDELAIKDQ